MGISLDLFISSVQEDFICSICQDVMEDAAILDPCEHAFCKGCIEKWQTQTTNPVNCCPVCREQIAVVKKPSRFFTNLLHSLEIRCPFTAEAVCCDSQLKLGDYFSHVLSCDSNPDKLSDCDGGCGLVLKTSERDGHNCVQYLRDRLACTKQELEGKEERIRELESLVSSAGAAGPPVQPSSLGATAKDLFVKINRPGCIGRCIDPERLNLLLAVIALELNTGGVPDTSEGFADLANRVEATAGRGITDYFQWSTRVCRSGEEPVSERLKEYLLPACHELCIRGFGLDVWVFPID